MYLRKLALALAVVSVVAACGTDSSRAPTAPAMATPAPGFTDQVWTGTFVSSNWSFSPFPVTMRLTRTGNAIRGSWLELQWLDFGGTIEGIVDDTSFTGTVWINECPAAFRGTLTATTLEWSSAGVSGNCGPLFAGLANPVDMKIQVSR